MTEEKTGMRPVVYVSKAPAVTEGLTVKEALAQRFTNYKVRLPRRSGTELIERRWSAKRPRAEFNIEDMLNYNEESQSPPASDLEALPNYELQPFWFYDVESGRSRWNNVNGIKYSFFNGLFSSKDSIMVPMKKRVPFRINGKIVQLSLYELLYHNGIVVKDDKRMKELKDVFSIVNLMVHYRIFATFLNVDGSTEMATEENPIEISPLHPPFVAFRPALWHQFLNTRQGVNRICDENYKYQCLIPSFSNLPSKELSPLEQLLAIVQIDTECLPEAVANNFGVSENLIDSILLTKQKVLRNMTRILVERTFENESSGKTTEQQENAAKLSPKVRRSTYGLNAIVWCLFKECATRGIKLNGKLVKKYALWIGHQIGLPDFKASEGWLDKLKKRHNMDFNEMTGEPGTYDDEDGDPKLELEAIRDDLMTKYEHVDNVCDGDQEAEATGSITIKSTGPLDLGPLDLFSGLIKTEPLDETDEPTASASQNGEEPAFLESLLRSVSTHIPNVELAYAVDLIRSYLVANDPGTLPLLAELQSRLAATVQASGETPYSK